jgi:hypothetical protein
MFRSSHEQRKEFDDAVRKEFRSRLLLKGALIPMPATGGDELDHSIPEREGSGVRVDQPAYPIPRPRINPPNEMLDMLETTWKSVKMNLPASAPTFGKLKEDGTSRPLADNRDPNLRIISQAMPLVETRRDSRSNHARSFCSEGDGSQAFFDQIPVKESDLHKNVVSTVRGNYLCKG